MSGVHPNLLFKNIMNYSQENFEKIPLNYFESIHTTIVNFLAIEGHWDKVHYLLLHNYPCDTSSTNDPRNSRIGFYSSIKIPIPTPLDSAISQKNGMEFEFLFKMLNKNSSSLRILKQHYGKSLANNFATGCFFLYNRDIDPVDKVKAIRDLFQQKKKELDNYFKECIMNRYLMPEYLMSLIRDSTDFVQRQSFRNMVITPYHYSGLENDMEKYFDKSVIAFIKSHRLRRSKKLSIYHMMIIPEIADNIKSYLI